MMTSATLDATGLVLWPLAWAVVVGTALCFFFGKR